MLAAARRISPAPWPQAIAEKKDVKFSVKSRCNQTGWCQRSACTTALILFLCVTGCSSKSEVNTTYGQRGGYAATSVSGTSVLSSMIQARGHRVTTEKNITPSLHQYDTIFWFPQDDEAPTIEQRKFFEAWLRGDDLIDEYDETNARLLVFVGRDFDAEAYFWGELAKRDKSEKRIEYLRRQGLANDRHRRSYPYFGSERYARWFSAEKRKGKQQVKELAGPWIEESDIDPEKVAMEYETVLVPAKLEDLAAEDWSLPAEYVMLEANGEPFVRNVWDEDMMNENGIILINNGSFLLNAPLVNKENRKLASKLIDTCEEFSAEEMKVAFLETDEYDNIPSSEEESAPTGLEAFAAWPLAPIIWHFTFLGIALCFCLLPIFGRPKQLRQDDQTDFGRHVKAVARLLAGTGNRTYAQRQIERYRQNASRRE
jgi:hypothetical protein